MEVPGLRCGEGRGVGMISVGTFLTIANRFSAAKIRHIFREEEPEMARLIMRIESVAEDATMSGDDAKETTAALISDHFREWRRYGVE